MTPHKKAPSKKTRSKSRPVPFPNIQSKLSPKKKKVQLETASREKKEREDRRKFQWKRNNNSFKIHSEKRLAGDTELFSKN